MGIGRSLAADRVTLAVIETSTDVYEAPNIRLDQNRTLLKVRFDPSITPRHT